jgi:hypothetical protein
MYRIQSVVADGHDPTSQFKDTHFTPVGVSLT